MRDGMPPSEEVGLDISRKEKDHKLWLALIDSRLKEMKEREQIAERGKWSAEEDLAIKALQDARKKFENGDKRALGLILIDTVMQKVNSLPNITVSLVKPVQHELDILKEFILE